MDGYNIFLVTYSAFSIGFGVISAMSINDTIKLVKRKKIEFADMCEFYVNSNFPIEEIANEQLLRSQNLLGDTYGLDSKLAPEWELIKSKVDFELKRREIEKINKDELSYLLFTL